MIRHRETPIRWLGLLWRTDAPLTATGIGMAVALALTLVGLGLDPRTITGAPAWLKPAKFAASLSIYSLTLAWIFTWLPGRSRMRRVVGRTTAAVFAVEFAIIGVQATRGTTSHFNTATLLDGMLFSVMGAGILLQTLASSAVLVALWRQRFDDRAMGWALRLGMSITIAAAFSGGLMTRPTPAQVGEALTIGRMTTSGAHTIGAPDGGPGLPGTGWSTTHRDLRVAHFAGLHAMQVLPLAALAVARLRRDSLKQVRMIMAAGSSYGLLFILLVWQARRGQSIVAPDVTTGVAAAAWLAATASALMWSNRPHRAAAATHRRVVIHDL